MMIRTGGEIATATQHFDGSRFRLFEDKTRLNAGGTPTLRMASTEYAPAGESPLDVSWLPACASSYKISPRIADYVLTEIPIITVGVPNRNMDCFTKEALLSWNTEQGKIAYQTFVGKPAHKDHDNRVAERAKGVIFDARIVEHPSLRTAKVHILVGWDRTKDRTLVADIASGKRRGHSMGCVVTRVACSFPGCGTFDTDGKIRCAHMRGGIGKGTVFGGQLLYEVLGGTLGFIESSSVEDPADHQAWQVSSWGNA